MSMPTALKVPMKRTLVQAVVAVATALALSAPFAVQAQETRPATPASTAGSTLRVFVDNCPCSLDYLRTEITYVDHVRDRADADVHLLFGYQGTGGGGTAFTIFFIGLRGFAGTADTLVYNSEASETEDQTRQGIVR